MDAQTISKLGKVISLMRELMALQQRNKQRAAEVRKNGSRIELAVIEGGPESTAAVPVKGKRS